MRTNAAIFAGEKKRHRLPSHRFSVSKTKGAKMKVIENPKSQAARMRRKMLRTGKIKSINTANSRYEVWVKIARFCKGNKLGNLESVSFDKLVLFLEQRSEEVGQSAVNIARSAAQMLTEKSLPRVKSEFETAVNSRAFFDEEITMIAGSQNARNAFATEIAGYAGLRGHELHTLRRSEERQTSPHREFHKDLYVGRPGKMYTVKGKGGLVRPVSLTPELAEQLESLRLPAPIVVYDREIRYESFYDLAGGKAWAASFTATCDRGGIRSTGAHGLRHTFAQKRLAELLALGFSYKKSLGYVSQAMGHFRTSITKVYLR